MKRGFTLIELIIVIIIIGILAAIAVPRFTSNIEDARKAEAIATMQAIKTAELLYYAMNNSYTSTFPIDITGIRMPLPTSSNFIYTVASTNATTGYIQAARRDATGGRQSYGMCLSTSKILAPCDAATCDPGC